MQNNTPNCRTCHILFDSWEELVTHILDDKENHTESSVKWAISFRLKQVMFKPEKKDRIPITEEQEAAKLSCQRELSGEQTTVRVFCAHCRQSRTETLPVEFAASNTAWRDKGRLVIQCEHCNRKSNRTVSKRYF